MKKDLAVIIGRFQVPELSEQHIEIFETLFKNHDGVMAVVCLSSVQTTKNNPLDYASRQQMLKEAFPNLVIRYIKDIRDDLTWGHNLEAIVSSVADGKYEDVTLYGSKHNFIDHYISREYDTKEIDQIIFTNPDNMLKSISTRKDKGKDFREGCFFAAHNQYDNPITTVDVAIIRKTEDSYQLLLGRKEHETEYRFIGGFTECDSESFEDDAVREVKEECGDIEISEPQYIGSYKIDDWRYRNETRSIKTLFYMCRFISGNPIPSDDIFELKWFDILEITMDTLVQEHRKMFDTLLTAKCSV